MKQKSHILLHLIVLLTMVALIGTTGIAANRYSVATGTWASTATWSATSGGASGASAPVAGDVVYIEGGFIVTIGAAAVCANLNIANGSALTVGGFTLVVSGTTTVTGNINFNNATGTKTFTGNVTLNSGAVWNETAAAVMIFSGGFANNATTFTASTGLHTFNAASGGTISGATATVIPSVTFSTSYTNSGTITCATVLNVTGGAVVLTNNGTITATTALSSSGGVNNGATGVLNIGGTSTITTLTATTAGNTVNYNRGGAQTAKVTTYYNLTLSGTNAKTFATTPIVNGVLSLQGTASVVVTTGVVTYGANATLQYNKSGAYTATAEEWISPFAATGGVIIANTGVITTGAAKTFAANVPLTINTGAALTTGATNTWTLTVGGITSISGTLTLANTGNKTFTGDVTINSGGVWNETGTAAINYAGSLQNDGATFTANTGVHTFSGATKTIGGAAVISIPTATFTGAYSNNGTLTVGTLLTVTGTTLTNNGTITASTALSGTGGVTQGTTGILNIGGTSGITTLTANAVGNTVNFTGGGAQTIPGLTYYDLGFSGAGTKTIAAGSTVTVNNNWAVGSTTTMTTTANAIVTGDITGTGAITMGSGTITVGGDFSNSGTFTPGTGTINYNGSSANQSVRGSITYYNLQISNGSTKLLQLGNTTVSNALNLTSCTITTNAYSIAVSSTGTVSRTSGYVIGNLNLYFATGATSHTFDIGDGSAYTPVTVSFANVTTAGSLTASTTNGDHPQILTSSLNNSKSANRYWTLTNSGIVFTTYNVVFTFVPADLDGSAVPASFSVGRYTGGTWSTPTIGTRTATTTQALGIVAFGDFQLGNVNVSGLGNYVISRTTGISYNSIVSTGNAIESWRNSVQWVLDDNRSNPIPVGFDFWYNGIRYTQLSVGINGFADFSSSTADGSVGYPDQQGRDYDSDNPSHNHLSNIVSVRPNTITWNALALCYGDLTTKNETDPLGASFKYITEGTPGNRILTVEWIEINTWNQSGARTGSYNFQLKLYESSGKIEFVYGTMVNGGGNNLRYKCGFNAADLSGGLNASVLQIQQTANTIDFQPQRIPALGYTETLPASNSKLTLTPNIPATPTSLSFSNVTSSSMRLSWNDVADNEVGYAIYRSDNGGSTYTFIRQLTAGSTYSDESGLVANITYYWKIYAVTEGGLSSALSGSYATLPAVAFISAQTGNWNTGTTWVGGVVPSTNADVTIDNGHIVTLDVNATLNLLTIGQGSSGTLHIGNNGTARTMTVAGDLTIQNGATLDVNTAFAQTGHAITLSGNLINNGILNLGPNASSAAGITFNKPYGTQTVLGTGTTTNFYTINANVGTTSSDILEVTSSNFSSLSAGFLTLTNGTFKMSTGATITPFSGSQTIPPSAGLWINHLSAVVNTIGGDLSVAGILHVTAGTLNIGNAANNRLVYSGGTFIIEGGAINVAGRIERANITTIIIFNMSGGVITVPTFGSTSTTVSPIELTVVGSIFTWSNGSIIVEREGGNGAGDLGYMNTLTNFTITGGTLQIGDPSTPAAQRMNINSTPYIYNLLVNNTNATANLVGNNTILGNITVTSGALETTLDGLVSFNGTAPQNITAISPIVFNNLTLDNSTGLSLSSSITVTRSLTLTNGALSIGASTLTFQTSDNPIIRTSGTITTTTSSNLVFGTSGNTGGAAFTIPAGTFTTNPDTINNFAINRTNNLTLNDQMMSLSGILLCNGPLTTNGNLTLLSTATQTAMIDGSSSGQVSGNVNMQRYLPSGFGYKYISSPFQTATVNEFSDDLDLNASFPTFYKYDENRTSSGWVSYTMTTNLLIPIQGYAANFGSVAIPRTVDVAGAVNNGILSITLYNHDSTYTKGFNLVGNPYPSPINWNAASGWTKTNIDNALYYFQAGSTDQYTGTYSTYINGISSDGLATNIIPSMQGFFIHVSDGAFPVTGTLGLTNSVRTNDLTHPFLKSMEKDTLPLLRISAGFTDDGTPSDPAVIYFDSLATQLFDKNLDALKLMNTDILVPNLYTITSDSKRLSISAMPFPADSIKTIPLGIKTAKDGWITFKIGDIEQMPTERYIYLVDTIAGVNQDLKLKPQYRTFLKAGECENRFSLVLSLVALNNIPKEFSLLQNYPNPFNPRTTIRYLIPQTSLVTITVYDILGREVSKLVNEEKLSGSYEVQFDGSKLSSGVYFYRLHAGNFNKTKKLMLIK